MLSLLLDAAVIIGIIYLVNQGDQMDFGPAVFGSRPPGPPVASHPDRFPAS